MVDDLGETIASELARYGERRGADAVLLWEPSHELARDLRFLRRHVLVLVFFFFFFLLV